MKRTDEAAIRVQLVLDPPRAIPDCGIRGAVSTAVEVEIAVPKAPESEWSEMHLASVVMEIAAAMWATGDVGPISWRLKPLQNDAGKLVSCTLDMAGAGTRTAPTLDLSSATVRAVGQEARIIHRP